VKLDPSAFLADPDLLKALEMRAVPVACDEERVLFHQGDPPVGLYILSRGEATLTLEAGVDQPIFTCRAVAGSLLGLPALIGNQPYSLSAIASRGAKVGFIDREAFGLLMQTELPLMVKILQVLAAEVRSARMAITEL
jgi:CRP-like cAMP-binding protein